MKEGAAEALDKARELCRKENTGARTRCSGRISFPGSIAGDYQQGGLFQVGIPGASAVASYRRTLDMQRGKASTRVQFGTGELSTEILAAPSGDCAAYRITCTLPAGCRVALDLRIRTRPPGLTHGPMAGS
ncbi:MAG: glycoside hydrolase N-terminal domain-containing protein [Akkermansia sp.]